MAKLGELMLKATPLRLARVERELGLNFLAQEGLSLSIHNVVHCVAIFADVSVDEIDGYPMKEIVSSFTACIQEAFPSEDGEQTTSPL